ncbi:hypothetical protein OIU74_004773 [Salix koriyanagi]|uniref:Uncharacterized protein n=1 Tax=Salix koriyanagi TaxID=2511006 RepID=A0A9Q0UMT7_9ROSI|nr:hypothetical protein OIU74_004773 [Salix koriyanagi]
MVLTVDLDSIKKMQESELKILAGDAASKTTDSHTLKLQGIYASQKAGKAAGMAHGKARDMRDLASEKADQMAANIKASNSRETLAGPMEYGRGKIEGACDEVNQKWNIVKDKVLDGANNIEDTMGGALGCEKIN